MNGGSGRADRTPRLRRAGRWLIVGAIAITVIAPILLGGSDALSATLHFSAQGYLAILALIAASWCCRAIKLQILLRRFDVPASLARVLGISLATDFAFMTTPGGVGGYAASLYYLRRAGASASGAATITAADQGMDVIFFVLALPIAGLCLIVSSTLGSGAPHALSTIAFATSASIVLLAVSVLLGRHKLGEWFAGISFGQRWPRLSRAHQAACAFLSTLRADAALVQAGGPRFLFNIFALTALQQLTRYSILWLALLLLGHSVAFPLVLLLQVFVLQAASWTGVPSGAGGAELGLTATLTGWVPATSLATALLLWRIATLYVALIAGAIAIAALARAGRRMISSPDTARAEVLRHGLLK
ncbi:MAG TPA: lysylphosphatidylglycerol synthase transmembrane domain-containing protein [Rudaea sp.]|jgi:uncharacterized protein (TIRG00374 family)